MDADKSKYITLITQYPDTRHIHIGLITNPYSRRNRTQLAAIKRIVADHPNIHHCWTQNADQIPQALERFAATGIDVLAINGGDGTVARILTEILNQRVFTRLPKLLLLPGGTTNMNASDVGLRGNLTRCVRRVVHWAHTGQETVEKLARPILRVQNAQDPRPVFGMFFGTGTIVRGIDYCQQRIHSLGLTDEIGPGLVMLRTFWGLMRNDPYFSAPTPIQISIDSASADRHREVLVLLISTLERLLLGARPYWGDESAPLHCTWVEKPARRLLRVLPSLLRGRRHALSTPDNGYFSHNAERIRLWMDGIFTLDGEMYVASREAGPVTISSTADIEFVRIR